MSQSGPVHIVVTIVGNPSASLEKAVLTLNSKQWPSVSMLFSCVDAMCNEQPFRIYWRQSEQEYMPIYSFISLRGALNLMHSPEIYVVTDELEDFESAVRDIHMLQFALCPKDSCDDLSAPFHYLRAKSPKLFTYDLRDTQRQLDILSKGFPQTKPPPLHSVYPQLKKDQSDAVKKKLRKE